MTTTSSSTKSQRELMGHEISMLARAGYPYLFLVSYEDERIVTLISELAKSLTYQVFIWSSRLGLYSFGQTPKRRKEPHQFSECIEDIERFNGPAFFIIQDAHHHLDSHNIIRSLRDNAERLREKSQVVLFVGTEEKVPADLSKDILTLYFPLPGIDELHSEVRTLCNKETTQQHMDLIGRAALGLTLREAKRAFRKAKIDDGVLDLKDLGRIAAEKQRALRNNQALTLFTDQAKLSDVGD